MQMMKNEVPWVPYENSTKELRVHDMSLSPASFGPPRDDGQNQARRVRAAVVHRVRRYNPVGLVVIVAPSVEVALK